jgi:DNA repair protein RadC
MTIQDEILINQLLHTQGIGQRLMGEWNDLSYLVKNLDAAKLTSKQRNTLTAAFQLQFIREEQGVFAINSPCDAATVVQYICNEPQEVLVVVCLNTRNHVVHKEIVYRGSVNSSQVRIAEVLRPAIIRRSSAIIVAHNHPSGDPTPSPDDVAVTRAIVSAGKIMDIQVLDHIIMGNGNHISLKQRDLGFS